MPIDVYCQIRYQAFSIAAVSTSPNLHMYHMKRLLRNVSYDGLENRVYLLFTGKAQTLPSVEAFQLQTCTSISPLPLPSASVHPFP